MKTQKGMFVYTYKLNRRCLYCDEPIADQIHKLRKHCFREVMIDGSVFCCKDDRHSELRSKNNPPYQAILKHHKTMHDNITLLLKAKGQLVCLSDLNNYGIILKRSLETCFVDGIYVYLFVGYKIKQLDKNNYKIDTYDRIF